MTLKTPDIMPIISKGGHPQGPEYGACIMEMASHLAGEEWSDRPKCVHPFLTGWMIRANDSLDDDSRQELLRLLPTVMDTQELDDPKVMGTALVAIEQQLDYLQNPELYDCTVKMTARVLDAMHTSIAAKDVQKNLIKTPDNIMRSQDGLLRVQIGILRSALCHDAPIVRTIAYHGQLVLEEITNQSADMLHDELADSVHKVGESMFNFFQSVFTGDHDRNVLSVTKSIVRQIALMKGGDERDLAPDEIKSLVSLTTFRDSE